MAENKDLVTVDQLVSGITKGKNYTDSAIAKSLTTVLKFKGSLAELPTPGADNLNNMYNMSVKFTTNENFTEPSGQEYPAGTNIAVVSPSEGVYKLDVMAGFVDLSDVVSDDMIADDDEVEDALDAIFDD